MNVNSKYKAKPIFYSPVTDKTYPKNPRIDGTLFFASTFEFLVYRELKYLVGANNVQCQVPIKIKERTRNYPQLNWRCDFRVWHPRQPTEYFNIEAKGIPTDEFKRVVQYLDLFSYQDYERLIVITNYSSTWINKEIRTWTLEDAIARLRDYFKLKL